MYCVKRVEFFQFSGCLVCSPAEKKLGFVLRVSFSRDTAFSDLRHMRIFCTSSLLMKFNGCEYTTVRTRVQDNNIFSLSGLCWGRRRESRYCSIRSVQITWHERSTDGIILICVCYFG